VDAQAPHRQPFRIPPHLERHRVVGRVEDPDRTRDLALRDRAGHADVCEVSRHGWLLIEATSNESTPYLGGPTSSTAQSAIAPRLFPRRKCEAQR
jgi:hypothetical protein